MKREAAALRGWAFTLSAKDRAAIAAPLMDDHSDEDGMTVWKSEIKRQYKQARRRSLVANSIARGATASV